MNNGLYTLLVFLIPSVGYIWFHKKSILEKRIKSKSGLELTYVSSIAGLIFNCISFLFLKSINYFLDISLNANLLEKKGLFLANFPEKAFIYIGFAAGIAYVATFFQKENNEIWLGDSELCEIWKNFVENQKVVVLFLKNKKTYYGLITFAEVSERVDLDQRIVSLIVLASGYRNDEGIVNWNTEYHGRVEHHFFMSEIVNFSEYASSATFNIKNPKKPKK